MPVIRHNNSLMMVKIVNHNLDQLSCFQYAVNLNWMMTKPSSSLTCLTRCSGTGKMLYVWG